MPLHLVQREHNRGACFFGEQDYHAYLGLGRRCGGSEGRNGGLRIDMGRDRYRNQEPKLTCSEHPEDVK